MIAANEAVARHLIARGRPTVFRHHEDPAQSRIELLYEQLAELDVATPPLPEGPLGPAARRAAAAAARRPSPATWAPGRGGRRLDAGAAVPPPGVLLALRAGALRAREPRLPALHLAHPPLPRPAGAPRPARRAGPRAIRRPGRRARRGRRPQLGSPSARPPPSSAGATTSAPPSCCATAWPPRLGEPVEGTSSASSTPASSCRFEDVFTGFLPSRRMEEDHFRADPLGVSLIGTRDRAAHPPGRPPRGARGAHRAPARARGAWSRPPPRRPPGARRPRFRARGGAGRRARSLTSPPHGDQEQQDRLGRALQGRRAEPPRASRVRDHRPRGGRARAPGQRGEGAPRARGHDHGRLRADPRGRGMAGRGPHLAEYDTPGTAATTRAAPASCCSTAGRSSASPRSRRRACPWFRCGSTSRGAGQDRARPGARQDALRQASLPWPSATPSARPTGPSRPHADAENREALSGVAEPLGQSRAPRRDPAGGPAPGSGRRARARRPWPHRVGTACPSCPGCRAPRTGRGGAARQHPCPRPGARGAGATPAPCARAHPGLP